PIALRSSFFFFFQAEDGIRDGHVTGVQTCALPISLTDKYGHDAFRYFLMREMTFGLDADFSEEALVGRLNADLANDLGNLVSRATTLLAKAEPTDNPQLAVLEAEREVRTRADDARQRVERAMEQFAFHRALEAIWEFIGAVNRYIDTTQPWALA